MTTYIVATIYNEYEHSIETFDTKEEAMEFYNDKRINTELSVRKEQCFLAKVKLYK